MIGSGDVVPARKPAPDIYRWVLVRLAIDGRPAIALEDSRNGVLSARGAGLPVVGTQRTYIVNVDFSGALAMVSDLDELDRPCSQRHGILTPLA